MHTQYIPINPNGVGKAEPVESYFFDLLGRSRIDSGHESNEGFVPELQGIHQNDILFDEDVNVYIVGLLMSLFDSKAAAAREIVVGINQNLGRLVQDTSQRSKKFVVYKVNADALLLNLGLFFRSEELPQDAYFDRGREYYASAAGYGQEVFGGRTATVEILEKMSRNFPLYVNLLRHASDHQPSFAGMFKTVNPKKISDLEFVTRVESMMRKM